MPFLAVKEQLYSFYLLKSEHLTHLSRMSQVFFSKNIFPKIYLVCVNFTRFLLKYHLDVVYLCISLLFLVQIIVVIFNFLQISTRFPERPPFYRFFGPSLTTHDHNHFVCCRSTTIRQDSVVYSWLYGDVRVDLAQVHALRTALEGFRSVGGWFRW